MSKYLMATLPRASRITPGTTNSFYQRRVSEFDAGINTSAAWTEHLVSASEGGSLSDEEPDYGDAEILHSARALYDFEGKAEFRELSVTAGDTLEVVKENLADGWSLVKNEAGEVGLLPRTYFTVRANDVQTTIDLRFHNQFTSDFTPAPGLELPPTTHHAKKPSTGSLTPRGSPKSTGRPIIPQNTGEWMSTFPSFRQSLLGGKSLNRFSSFVTSGAEEFVLKGSPTESVALPPVTVPSVTADHDRESSNATIDEEEINRINRLGLGEADRHFVDAGPVWKEKIPPFRVLVHSPSKRTSTFSTPYTIYNVTSLFRPPPVPENDEYGESESTAAQDVPSIPPSSITVYRRFSHFVILHTALTRRLPGIALPPLPEKQYAGRFSNDFVEARRGDLERYIGKIIRHPIARYAEVVTFFLGCESEVEWDRLVPQHLAMPAAGPTFYARVFHPAFNVDADDAQETVDRFETHTKAVGKGVQGLRNIFGRVREARVEMSTAERLLSYSLLSLITSKPLASAPMTGVNEEDDLYDVKSKGLLNEDGAWCWREDCQDCLKLTKAMQKTAETIRVIADSYDDHARRSQLATHESLKGMAHPSSLYEPIVTTHKETLSRYQEATREGQADEELVARCETVLNTTLAEMETYHTQKLEDFSTLAKEHLDGEIQFYEQILTRLRTARGNFEQPAFDELAETPRQSSMYERELENPRLNAKLLPQPCPHIFDSAPMRPVSVAIQEGVGILLGPSTRGSVFGKFW
ncbi:hypothetical protein DXG01_000290 [Tephrocybe rancida]|nr:hypothetical protein DXG01_000290 [Tephrocybe rancida]